VESWACPACALLGLEETDDMPSSVTNPVVEAVTNKPADRIKAPSGREIMDPFGRTNVKKRLQPQYSTTGKFNHLELPRQFSDNV
jgi:hypothetical protein